MRRSTACYPSASAVVRDCAKLDIELPAVELLDLMSAWSDLLT